MKFTTTDIIYEFLTMWANNWVFRTTSIMLLLLVIISIAYFRLEIIRHFHPGKRLDELCFRLIIFFGILLETFVAFRALTYVLGY